MNLAHVLEGEQAYESLCPLLELAREELSWWVLNIDCWNGKSLVVGKTDLLIESDASLTGWGASSLGSRTGGPWSVEEKNLHINCLELLAAFLAVKSFLNFRTSLHNLLKMTV